MTNHNKRVLRLKILALAAISLLFVPETKATGIVNDSIPGDILFKTPVPNLTNTLYGILPGLHVREQSGEPGNDAATLTIRGIGSYGSHSYAVLVDGFYSSMDYVQYLSASEIESVKILKDASALALYGLKGANGVIYITTKRGREGRLMSDVRFRSGITSLSNITEPLRSYEYASLYNEALSNDNGMKWTPAYSPSQLSRYKEGRATDVDWYAKTLRDFAPYYSGDISLSGGNKNARYFVLADFTETNGMYNVSNDDNHSNSVLRMYSLRSNFDFSLFDFVEGKVDLGGRIETRKAPAYSTSSLWRNLERYPSNIYPSRNADGSWTGTNVYPDNPLASIRELGIWTKHDTFLQSNLTLKERLDFIAKGLYISEAISFSEWNRGSRNVTKNYARMLDSVAQTSDEETNYSISDDYGTNQWNHLQFRAEAGYAGEFGPHSVTARLTWMQSVRNVDKNMNGDAGIDTRYAHANLAAVLDWSYIDRYSVSLSGSYSGSDNYRKGKRFHMYPSVAAAWNISAEDFMAGAKAVGQLRIKASAGLSGYDSFDGGRYLYREYYKTSGTFPIGNSTPEGQSGIEMPYIPYYDVCPEQSAKYDLSLDAILFSRLSFSATAFLDKRSRILSEDNSIMAASGEPPYYRNLGKTTTKGLELSIAWNGRAGKFDYGITAVGTWIRDRIDYMSELPPASPAAAYTAKAIGSIRGYRYDGLYGIEDFNPDGTLIGTLPQPSMGSVQPGDMRYKDINGDNIVDERDMTIIGKGGLPVLYGSIIVQAGYAGFDFRAVIQGEAGRDVNLLSGAYNKVVAFKDNSNVYPLARRRWAYYPEQGIDTRATATYPRLSLQDNKNNYVNSDFWVKDADFIKIRNIEIGWSLPSVAASKMKLSSARIFISGINLFSFSKLLRKYDIDPETMSGYPGVKSYNLGLTLTF